MAYYVHMAKDKRLSKFGSFFARIDKKGLFLSISALTIGLAVLLLAIDSYRDFSNSTNRAEQSTWYHSLDLGQAGNASYKNLPVNREKDLGIAKNARTYIVSFKVPKDDLIEYGLMTMPTTSRPKTGYPVVVLMHSYSAPQSYSTLGAYLDDMQFYSQHGFVVIKPDLRGQGLSLPDGTANGAFYSMDYNTDTLSLIAAIQKTNYLDAKRINLWGHSMGAYVALRAAVLSPAVKSVAILAGPVGDLADMYGSYEAVSDQNNAAAAETRANVIDQYGTPLSNPDFWVKASPIRYAGRTKAYFQIFVGSNDKTVPPQFSADLDAALTKANKTHAYYVYPDGDHGLVNQRPDIWQKTLTVFEKP